MTTQTVSPVGTDEGRPQITLAGILDTYDVVDLTGRGALIVTERGSGMNMSSVERSAPTGEIGGTGQTSFGMMLREDYNPALAGYMGLKKWDEMRRNDAQVRATLRLLKTPVLAARWYVDAASESTRDQKIAEFIWWNLVEGMSSSWPQTLWEALLMADFGYYLFEKVFDFTPDGKVYWRKFAPRHPLDVSEWEFDEHGGPVGVHQYKNAASSVKVFIPIQKLLIFTFDKEAGNVEGISALRSAYKHWFFKETLYKIDAIQKERHGIGIPVIKLPANFNPTDRALADEIGRNLRTNEKAHIVLPPNWEVLFAKIEGQPVDCMKSVEHHDKMIARNILGQFINADQDPTGQMDLFGKSTRYIADIVRDVINRYAIPQLVKYNWPNVERFPQLKARRIGETTDWRTISFAMRNFVGAGLMTPDDRLEDYIRDEMDAPRRDPETARTVATPQNPGTAKPPRQATTDKTKQGKTAGGSNVGKDGSGG